jgi:PAS domain S-box-containing protein
MDHPKETIPGCPEEFRMLVESAKDPIFTTDSKGRFLYLNPAAASWFRTTPEKIVGRFVGDLFPPIISEKYVESISKVFRTGEGMTLERQSEVNGVPFWFSTSLQPIRGRDGRVRCVQGVVRDISRIKEAERELAKSEERLKMAAGVTGIGIFEHDHRTDTIFWSPKIFDLLDWEPGKPLSLPEFLERLHPEDREAVRQGIPRAHDPAGDGLYDVAYRLLLRDGSTRFLTARSRTFFEGDGADRRPVRTVGAVRDITSQKQAEREKETLQRRLFQAQKMESIGRLAGGVAHDLNNMLTVIQGYVGMTLDRIEPGHPAHADLLEVMKAAQRSADLARRLLAFARRQAATPKVVDLNGIVAGSLPMLHRLAGEGIRLDWAPERNLWPVKIDPLQVDQVLTNLVANARDAVGGKGKIAVRTRNAALGADSCAKHPESRPGDYAILEVADDGCGMDPVTKALLFEPFFTTKPEGQGTGLGLSSVYGIVRQNGGFIDVRSEPEQGTEITVCLPRFAEGGSAGSGKRPEAAPRPGAETVLLVDDEESVLNVNKALLERLGHTVLPASSPEEAIRLAREHAGGIRLLVTDIVMPGMNGRELAGRLLSLNPGLKCLYVSGYLADGIARHGFSDREIFFLQKPFSLEDLASKVREALGS